MSFRENLRETLDFMSMEQKELAAKTGLSLKTIENYVKKDSSIPSADRAVLIAGALGVTVEFLVTGQDNNKKSHWHNHTVRSINQMLIELNNKDIETIHSLTKVLIDQQKPGALRRPSSAENAPYGDAQWVADSGSKKQG